MSGSVVDAAPDHPVGDVAESEENQPLYMNLNPDDPEQGVMEIESLCPNCEEQGMTRLMLTRIPYFRELILSSFECENCGHNNRHVQYGGRIQEQGLKYEVCIKTTKDLDRQVIKSEAATFRIPELNFEQPPSKKGEITTVEGLINGVIRGLSQEQPIRKTLHPDLAVQIEEFISKLEKLKMLPEPFNIVIDDPSGNSFVENLFAPAKDDAINMTHYTRTAENDVLVGLRADDDDALAEEPEDGGHADITCSSQPPPTVPDADNSMKDEVLSFPTNCPSCNAPCATNMKVTEIPFFKEVIIMATTCDVCGNRESEVKGGAGVEDKGSRITLKVTDPSDLNRDVLKSDTCGVIVPEIGLELVEGTLGGRFTTVEGLLLQVKEQLQVKNPFIMGDSAATDTKSKMDTFLEKLDSIITGEMTEFTMILNDPAGNSYVQNLYAPDPDPEMTIERYTRTAEQNDELGLLHMKTENYTESHSS